MAAITICSDFGAQKNKVWHCFHCFHIYFPWGDGSDAMILIFWMLSFMPTFSLSSFTFIKRLVSSSSVSAIRVVSSAYLRLLICTIPKRKGKMRNGVGGAGRMWRGTTQGSVYLYLEHPSSKLPRKNDTNSKLVQPNNLKSFFLLLLFISLQNLF